MKYFFKIIMQFIMQNYDLKL